MEHTEDELEKLTAPEVPGKAFARVYKDAPDKACMYKTRGGGWKPVSSGMSPSDVEETVKHHNRSGLAARFSEKQGKFLISSDSGLPAPKEE